MMKQSNLDTVESSDSFWQRSKVNVGGIWVDKIDWDSALQQIAAWARNHESRYVCITNVHSLVTGLQDEQFGEVLRSADMVTPDGAPVAWMISRLSGAFQERINGPDLMWRYCESAAKRGESIFLFGGTLETLDCLKNRLYESFPGLKIAGSISPPFREISADEDKRYVEEINSSGAGVVWVSLGCPKQEVWMFNHRGLICSPMLGVGAAFDYHAGIISRAPLWMRRVGLEWFHRLCSEPRRLWRRYSVTNSIFLAVATKQLLRLYWRRLLRFF